jgi:hypothetical protein
MSQIPVYNFRLYDIQRGKNVVVPRKATRQFIEMVQGEVLKDTEEWVDQKDIDGNGQVRTCS